MPALASYLNVVNTAMVNPYQRPIQKTNAVSLKVFGSVWLLQDEYGKAVAVGIKMRGRDWASKGIIEQFSAGKGNE